MLVRCDTPETALSSPPSPQEPSYDAIMKNLKEASLLLASVVLLAVNALAQTDHPPAGNETPSSVAAARCAYTAGNACTDESSSSQATRGTIDDDTVAQLPRRGPGPAFGAHRPMGRPAYPQMWQAQPSGRHALIGAAIGTLVGLALSAKGNLDAHSTAGLTTVGAALGAGIGLSIPAFPSRSPYFRRWPDDEDGNASGRNPAKPGRIAPGSAQQTVSGDAAPSNLRPGAGGNAGASRGTP